MVLLITYKARVFKPLILKIAKRQELKNQDLLLLFFPFGLALAAVLFTVSTL